MIEIQAFNDTPIGWLQKNGSAIEAPETYSGQKYLACYRTDGIIESGVIIQDQKDFEENKKHDGIRRSWFLVAKPAVAKLTGTL